MTDAIPDAAETAETASPGSAQEAWNALAADSPLALTPIAQQTAPALLAAARLRPGDAALDICCGPGAVAAAVAALGFEARGVDFAPAMIAEARRRFGALSLQRDRPLDYQIGDAQALDVREGHFAAAFSNFGLCSAADPARALREARRALRPGGRLVCATWSAPARSALEAAATEGLCAAGAPVDAVRAAMTPRSGGAALSDAAMLAAAGFALEEVFTVDLLFGASEGEATGAAAAMVMETATAFAPGARPLWRGVSAEAQRAGEAAARSSLQKAGVLASVGPAFRAGDAATLSVSRAGEGAAVPPDPSLERGEPRGGGGWLAGLFRRRGAGGA